MKIIAKKCGVLKGEVIVPASKSHTVRGIILGLLSKGKSVLKNPLHSTDTEDAIRAARALGAKIETGKDRIVIKSGGVPFKNVQKSVYTGNSGITTRFVLPLLGLRKDNDVPVVFDCGEQMRSRPIKPLVRALNALGMDLKLSKKEWPLRVAGPLLGGKVKVNGLSSQYLSALLLSLPSSAMDSVVTVDDLHERPYIEMTELWLKELGVSYKHKRRGGSDSYAIEGRQRYKNFTKTIPGDFSSASYFIAAAALIPGKVAIKGLNMDDSQGDKQLIYILKKMGADIRIFKNRIIVRGGKPLRGIKIDANPIPDLVPALAVIGTYARGKTEIVNVLQARIKETDRLRSMARGLSTLGAKIIEKKDGLVIHKSDLKGARVHGYDDHRTVMSLSLAGMLADGETVVDTAEAIRKTFPEYVQLMKKLGGRLQVKNK